jgi:translation initiation factor eIF-2B subunit epsilon
MGVDADYHEVRRAIITAFMRRIQQLTESRGLTVAEAVNQVVKTYHNVFSKTIFDREKDVKVDQVDFLLLLQRDLVHRAKGETILLFMAKALYDVEVLEEDGFNQWWQDERSKADEEMRRVRAQTEQFVKWLAEAAEEDSDEEDDDD